MNIISKAHANLNLTPMERAALKTGQSLIISGMIAAFLAAGQYLTQAGTVDWRQLFVVAFVALLFSVAHGVAKYFTAQGDPPLQAFGAAADTLVSDVEHRYQPPQPPQSPPTLPPAA